MYLTHSSSCNLLGNMKMLTTQKWFLQSYRLHKVSSSSVLPKLNKMPLLRKMNGNEINKQKKSAM